MNIPAALEGRAGYWINVIDHRVHGEKHWDLPEDTTGLVLIREIPDNTPVPGGVVVLNSPDFLEGIDAHVFIPYEHTPQDWDVAIAQLGFAGMNPVSIGIIVGIVYAANDPIQIKSEGA